MEPSDSASSIQQQLREYRLKKQREAQASSSQTTPSQPTPPRVPVIKPASEEEKKVPPRADDDLVWKARQEEYKKGLLQGSIKPPKYKVYDFTKGSENERRARAQNYEFVPSGQAEDPEYKKDDLKALHAAISGKPETKESPSVGYQYPSVISRNWERRNEEEEEEKDYERPRGNAANREDAQVPLLRSLRDSDQPITRNFLCFRNINRDILGLLAIALLLAGVIGFLFLISK